MKRCISLLLACVVSVATLAGCGTTPRGRYHAVQEGFNATRKVVLDLHASGIVGDADLVAMDRAEKVGRGALEVARTQLPDGGEEFEDWLAVARGALGELAKTYGGTQ